MLTEMIGNLVLPKPKQPRFRINATNSLDDKTSDLPIIQRNAVPRIIDPLKYKNAYSPENLEGDISKLYAFSKLVDPMPKFTRYYSESVTSLEKYYSHIIKGACSKNDYIRNKFSDAVKTFEDYTLTTPGTIPSTFHPVYADPYDWYESKNFVQTEFDLTSDEGIKGRYRIIPISDKKGFAFPNQLMDNSLGDQNGAQKLELDPETKLNLIKFRYKAVTLYREWLDFGIFLEGDWYVNGIEKGGYSSGNIEENSGRMPLITSTILLATEVKIEGDFAGDDKKKIEKNDNLSYGPFALTDKIQIFGWISSLVPLSPRLIS